MYPAANISSKSDVLVHLGPSVADSVQMCARRAVQHGKNTTAVVLLAIY